MEIKQCSNESPLSQEEIKKEIKDFLAFNENYCTAIPNLWGTLKVALRGKFIPISSYIKNLEKSQTGDLTAFLKTLEQKEVNSPRKSK